jgi:hypothetical protein
VELTWIDSTEMFTQYNFPNTINFDYEIKKDIIQRALSIIINFFLHLLTYVLKNSNNL